MKTLIKLICFVIYSCAFAQDNFPKEQYYQFDIDIKHSYINDHIVLDVKNTNKTAVRIVLTTDNEALNKKYKLNDTIVFNALESKKVRYYVPSETKFNYTFNSYLGNPDTPITKNKLALPFPKGKTYIVTQAYNDTLSHNNIYNKYALDFNLQVNDTICSADYGIVVGVIKDYKYGGSSKKWKEVDKGNYITIYHPHSGLYTQYYHLIHLGSMVQIGDRVNKGQPIGLSGLTGFTTGPHLHFCVLIPKKGGTFISTPVDFENDINGEDLKIGSIVSH